jgi:hypothetical protein
MSETKNQCPFYPASAIDRSAASILRVNSVLRKHAKMGRALAKKSSQMQDQALQLSGNEIVK